MKKFAAGMLSFAATFLVGAVLVAAWLTGGPGRALSVRLPDSGPVGRSGQGVPEKVVGELKRSGGVAADVRGEWRGFRGPMGENVSDDFTELARTWLPAGPPELWSKEVGEGYAGCAVLAGRIYLQDYDAKRRREMLRCFSLADGQDLWVYSYKFPIKRTHGYTRTVPALTEEHVVLMGSKCHVSCLDANTGALRWDLSLVNKYGTTVPQWYTGQCPIIDDGNVILAPCGHVVREEGPDGKTVTRGKSVLMTALNCETGKVVWEVPNDDGWEMAHGCIAVMELEDYSKMYVYCASGGVVGVSTDGRVLWKKKDWTVDFANVPTPVPIRDNRLFLCGGYGAGSAVIRIEKEGEAYVARELWRKPPSVFGSQQQTPVFYKNHLFGTRQDGQFVCLTTRGEVVWSSGPARKFGKDGGAYLIADDLVYLLDDDGVLTMLEATPQAYKPLEQRKVLPGHHSWAPMAIVAGRLLLRDDTVLKCLDVSKKSNQTKNP